MATTATKVSTIENPATGTETVNAELVPRTCFVLRSVCRSIVNAMMNNVSISAAVVVFVACVSVTSIASAEDSAAFVVADNVQAVFNDHCVACHSADTAEADVRLDNLATLPLNARLALLNRVQDQLFFGTMPPADETQPTTDQKSRVANWTRQELRTHNASELDKKLRYPEFGNYVDHEALFGGSSENAAVEEQPFTPARRWLVSPQIFHERVNDVFGLTDRARQKTFYGVTNPFVLPDHSGVRDYDHSTLDGGHLLVMLNNAKWISEKQIFGAMHAGKDRRKLEFSNAKDRWYPPTSPPAFVAIVEMEDVPSEQQLTDAIQTQFQSVLNREANPVELTRYLSLLRSTIELGGNQNGLRQMLVSVLLESEFLYRHEFGSGEPDEYGRVPLASAEAAQAIAYALGDRGPDALLQQAADEGRLSTKDDYQREVKRLLADDEWFNGPVDAGLSGKNMRSHVATHPKLVRFFREFFGYPGAVKVFKDIKRSDGFYQNPSRGTSGTPGFLVKEADRVVDWYLQHDEDVFRNLLTTENFFVYHDKDNAAGEKVIAEWKEVYAKLKATDWKTDPEKVIEENIEFIKSKKSLRIIGGRQRREFLRHMYFWGETIGKGRTPFTTVSFAHGYTYNHSPFYNLPPTPHIFRYGAIEQKNFKGLDDIEFWDYPVEQPFTIADRKGLLTHPAWLIAHSGNFQTDPIRRGRWIREKLLAGHVPDVPITVDAQVPDNPHQTFRERVETVTGKAECWKCHQHMNPLGLPFESFDDFGRFRTEESLEHPDNVVAKGQGNKSDQYKMKPVMVSGQLGGTDDLRLDGDVVDAFELIDRLSRSTRVRQSIIRYAFRFFMGRNEMLSDSKTLIDADNAYVDNGGSFKAVVVSLLTSDSFRFRKDVSADE